MEQTDKPINKNRREFTKYATTAGLFAALFGAGAFIAPKLKASDIFLRPPGALSEDDFLATCIKCGQCIQVCPYHSLFFLDAYEGLAVGTPHIDARSRGCYLCDLLPCVLACPSGALDHSVTDAKDVDMGIAFLKRPDKCYALLGQKVSKGDLARFDGISKANEREIDLANKIMSYEGKECTMCADICPYPDRERAIGMVKDEKGRWYPEVRADCVGCGACEEVCPVSGEAAIVVLSRVGYGQAYKGKS